MIASEALIGIVHIYLYVCKTASENLKILNAK